MDYVLLVLLDAVFAIIQLVFYVLMDIMGKGSYNSALVALLAVAAVHLNQYVICAHQDFSLQYHRLLHHRFRYVILASTLVLSAPVILLALHVK